MEIDNKEIAKLVAEQLLKDVRFRDAVSAEVGRNIAHLSSSKVEDSIRTSCEKIFADKISSEHRWNSVESRMVSMVDAKVVERVLMRAVGETVGAEIKRRVQKALEAIGTA